MRTGCCLRRVLLLGVLVAAVGCHVVTGLSDFAAGDGGGGAGAGGGLGGAGGEEPTTPLVGDGLIARYFLDESAAGTPTELLDDGPDALHLVVIGDQNVQYTETDGHRGLSWSVVAANGRGERIGVADSLNETTTATIEVVMEMTASSMGPRVFHVGSPLGNGLLAIARHPDGVNLRVGDNTVASWNYDTTMRHVVHVRIDLTQPMAAQRAVLFVNGNERAPAMSIQAADLVLFIPDNAAFVLGNRQNGDRSPVGTIYYFALYSTPLSDQDIAANAAELTARDDGPPAP